VQDIEKRKEYNQLKKSYAQYAEDITRQQDEISQLKEKVAKYHQVRNIISAKNNLTLSRNSKTIR
jgi:cell division septum initiation protein DivIVA